MICQTCGGVVLWRGPMTALTHTECTECGAINNQAPEARVFPACDGDCVQGWELCENCDGAGEVPV